MINIPVDKIKEKILEESNITEETLNAKIKEKLDQLSGLISEQGAAHIVANELGVKLVQTSGRLQITNIVDGLRNVETVGKVVRKYELREFQTKDGREGKVANFLLGDDTGVIRIVCWNEQTDKFESLNEGDVILIKSGYVRENMGKPEVHLNDKAELTINPEGVKVDFEVKQNTSIRKKLTDLTEDDEYVEVLATIVQVFDVRFFEVFADSGKKVPAGDDSGKETEFSYVMNAILDDGSDNIRCVFWRRQTQRLIGAEDETVQKYRESPEEFEAVKNDLLGNIVKVKGSVKKNEGYDKLELVARYVERDPDPEDEIKALNEEAEKVVSEPAQTKDEKPAAEEEKPAPAATEETSAAGDEKTSEPVEVTQDQTAEAGAPVAETKETDEPVAETAESEVTVEEETVETPEPVVEETIETTPETADASESLDDSIVEEVVEDMAVASEPKKAPEKATVSEAAMREGMMDEDAEESDPDDEMPSIDDL